MNDISSEDDEEIERQVLGYLENHPSAADTVDGIAQWWLLREWAQRRLAVVERAVSNLVSKGLIVEVRREGLPPYYRLNREKQKEISHILKALND